MATKQLTLPKLIKKAQEFFNAWIRERDKNLPCISCGGPVQQAGHYYSAGQHTAIRFDEDNCNGQCVQCNYYKHGNLIEYRKNLVKKIGEERMLRLEWKASECKKHPRKWQRFEVQLIIDTYKQKIKQAA